MTSPTPPTLAELLKLFPQLTYLDVNYVLTCLEPRPVLDDEDRLTWADAYGVAIYALLRSTLGRFTGDDAIRRWFPSITRQIIEQTIERFTEAGVRLWRVMLVDGRYVVVDGCDEIHDLHNWPNAINNVPLPIFTVSADLTRVWPVPDIERLRNV